MAAPPSLALERGIHFEFSYAPAIRDATSRRYLFSNVLALIRLTRGRNLVLSSAATKEMELRAPWDTINLSETGRDKTAARTERNRRGAVVYSSSLITTCCFMPRLPFVSFSAVLCGIDAATSKASISAHARSVLLHAEARKTLKCVLREVPTTATAAASNHPRPATANDDTKHRDKKAKTSPN